MGSFVWIVAEDRGEPDTRMLALFGLPPESPLGLKIAMETLLHPDDRERYAAAVARATDPEGDGSLREDVRVVWPDGTPRWLAVAERVAFEGSPRRPTRMAGTAVDVTDRKRAEEARRESEERQAYLLKLSDALRPLADAVAIQAVASRLLGEHLGVDRAYYVSIDESRQAATVEQEYRTGEAPSVVGTHSFASYGAVTRRTGSISKARASASAAPSSRRSPWRCTSSRRTP